jgi:hypothetical protein
MTDAHLGFSIDSSPVRQAVTDLDALPAAAANAESKVVRLGTSSKKAFAETGAAATEFAKRIQQSAQQAESMADRINRALNIKTSFGGADRGKDIEEYGRKLDNLRARYDPLFAVIKRYKQTVEDIKQAHSVGALSADRMSLAISRERQEALASIAALKGRKAAIDDVTEASSRMERTQSAAQGGRNQRFQTSNVGYQLQDIFSTSALGMSPLTVALQQAPQLTDALGGNGVKGAVTALGGAFASLVSPLSLATIATVGLASAGIGYITELLTGTKKADEAIKLHAQVIRDVKDAYGDATTGLDDFLRKSSEETAAFARINLKNQTEQLKSDMTDFIDSLVPNGGLLGRAVFAPEFEPFRKAILDLKDAAKQGTPDLAAFRQQVEKRVQDNPGFRETGDNLLKLAEAAFDSSRKVEQAKAALALVGGTAAAQVAGVQELAKALAQLANIGLPDASDIERIAAATQQGMSAIARRDPITFEEGRRRLLNNQTAARQRVDSQYVNLGDGRNVLAPTPEARPKIELEGLPGFQKQAKAAESAAKSAANAYRDLLKSAQDRVDQMKLESELAGKSGVAADALRMKLELLQQGENKGRDLSPSQVKAIEDKVAAYKKYAEAAANANAKADLLFEREQMGRSATDQTIASFQKSYGLEIDMGSELASMIRFNEQLKFSRELAGDFTDTFFNGIEQGKDAWESLGDAALSVLKTIGDSLLNDVLNNIFAINNSSGSTGLFGSILGGLFGGGGGSKGFNLGSGATAYTGSLPGYASGTPSARAGVAWVGENGPELVRFKGGEEVVPNHRLNVPANGNSSSSSSGPMHIDARTTIDARGADSEAVARLQAAQARRDAELPAKIIDTVKEAQRRRLI